MFFSVIQKFQIEKYTDSKNRLKHNGFQIDTEDPIIWNTVIWNLIILKMIFK